MATTRKGPKLGRDYFKDKVKKLVAQTRRHITARAGVPSVEEGTRLRIFSEVQTRVDLGESLETLRDEFAAEVERLPKRGGASEASHAVDAARRAYYAAQEAHRVNHPKPAPGSPCSDKDAEEPEEHPDVVAARATWHTAVTTYETWVARIQAYNELHEAVLIAISDEDQLNQTNARSVPAHDGLPGYVVSQYPPVRAVAGRKQHYPFEVVVDGIPGQFRVSYQLLEHANNGGTRVVPGARAVPDALRERGAKMEEFVAYFEEVLRGLDLNGKYVYDVMALDGGDPFWGTGYDILRQGARSFLTEAEAEQSIRAGYTFGSQNLVLLVQRRDRKTGDAKVVQKWGRGPAVTDRYGNCTAKMVQVPVNTPLDKVLEVSRKGSENEPGPRGAEKVTKLPRGTSPAEAPDALPDTASTDHDTQQATLERAAEAISAGS